jgi:hypothetical protein
MTRDEIIAMAEQEGLIYKLRERWWMDAGEPGDELEQFAKLVRKHTCNDLANQIDKMPFGDTAASFAVWIREQA